MLLNQMDCAARFRGPGGITGSQKPVNRRIQGLAMANRDLHQLAWPALAIEE